MTLDSLSMTGSRNPFFKMQYSANWVHIYCNSCKKTHYAKVFMSDQDGKHMCMQCFSNLKIDYNNVIKESSINENTVISSLNTLFVFDNLGIKCPDPGHDGLLVDHKMVMKSESGKKMNIIAKKCLNCGRTYIDQSVYKKYENELKDYDLLFNELNEIDENELQFKRELPEKDEELIDLENQLLKKKKKLNKIYNASMHKKIPYQIQTGMGMWKKSEKLRTYDDLIKKCAICGGNVKKSIAIVPINSYQWARVPALECVRCGTLYVHKEKALYELLTGNSYAKNYTIDGRNYYDYDLRKVKTEISSIKKRIKAIQQERLSYVKNAVFMISIVQNKEVIDYIIIDGGSDMPSKNIIHYSTGTARELITAGFHNSRNNKGFINNIPYKVLGLYYPAGSVEELPETIAPTSIAIKPGGGFYSSITSKEKIVDLLFFVPKTDRYEIMKATMTINLQCYIDIKRYRAFIYKYGKPEIELLFNDSHGFVKSWADLNQESVMRMYGYTVGQEAGLKKEQRIELLKELVDLGIMSVSEIVYMLNLFIRTHPNDKDYDARMKWIEDREFIQDYKINPERFLIAKA